MQPCYKRIPLSNAYNVRDLGGYATLDGGVTNYHQLYRADGLHNLNKSDWTKLKDLGIKTIIDLRSESERKHQAYDATRYGIERLACPLQRDDIDLKQMEQELAKADFSRSMSERYIQMIEEGEERLIEIIHTICDKIVEGGILFHCTAGKDRTGILAATLLYLCDVSEYDIIADYQVTATYNEANQSNTLFKACPVELLTSPPERMRKVLTYFKARDLKTYYLTEKIEQDKWTQFKRIFIAP